MYMDMLFVIWLFVFRWSYQLIIEDKNLKGFVTGNLILPLISKGSKRIGLAYDCA